MTEERERYDFDLNWPPHVRCVGLDGLSYLGVDDAGNLYWQGKQVEVRQGLTLTRWQRIGAVVITVSTAVAAIAAVVQAIAAVTNS